MVNSVWESHRSASSLEADTETGAHLPFVVRVKSTTKLQNSNDEWWLIGQECQLMSGIHARVSLRTDRFVSCVRFYPRIRSSEVVELMRRAEPGDENLSMRIYPWEVLMLEFFVLISLQRRQFRCCCLDSAAKMLQTRKFEVSESETSFELFEMSNERSV